MTEIYQQREELCNDCGMNACKSYDHAKKDKDGNIIECCVYYPNYIIAVGSVINDRVIDGTTYTGSPESNSKTEVF